MPCAHRIDQVPSVVAEEIGHICTASLAWWRSESAEFLGSAGDFLIPERENQEGAHDVFERVQPIQPIAPESLNLAVGDERAVEGDQCADDDGVDRRCCCGCWRVGCNRLTDAGCGK